MGEGQRATRGQPRWVGRAEHVAGHGSSLVDLAEELSWEFKVTNKGQEDRLHDKKSMLYKRETRVRVLEPV